MTPERKPNIILGTATLVGLGIAGKVEYDWCKEKLTPEPTPQPVPVKTMQLYPIL